MPRTIIDIPNAQLRDLDARCRALGISRAEAIRRAVRAFLSEASTLEQDGFGLWTHTTQEEATRSRVPDATA
jgi:metal-responsive CopG/Arc/MetJ family transcriptional regulator